VFLPTRIERTSLRVAISNSTEERSSVVFIGGG
jgi:hypothetical protein